jgi:hypothetical protein
MSPWTVQTVAKIKFTLLKKIEKHDSDNCETNNGHNFLHFARHCAHTARRIRQGSNRVGRNKLRLLNTEPPLIYAHAVFLNKNRSDLLFYVCCVPYRTATYKQQFVSPKGT